ncbi:unnamed protein product [Lactuca saligna]|uniref:Uncharacterized protein n=1 Tax=Lactuca saligna TaxID=75948 RepID=A0AA36DZ15_LACSI|nr:unnamed protein product [Lactuca saligna]
MMNKHIRFSTTSLSSSSVDDSVKRGSTPPFMETVEPMIQEEIPPKPTSPPPPQAKTVPSRPTPINTFAFHQGDNHNPPPCPSTNLPPPFHSPPCICLPPSNSPPQSDAAKKEENNQKGPHPIQL